MKSNFILDTCAVIAFLRDESGAKLVETILLDPDYTCYIHAMNLCEVYYAFMRSNNQVYADQMINDLEAAGVIFKRILTPRFWKLVAGYKATITRISLADCCALALTTDLQGTLLTSDHYEFDPIAPLQIVPIHFIR